MMEELMKNWTELNKEANEQQEKINQVLVKKVEKVEKDKDEKKA